MSPAACPRRLRDPCGRPGGAPQPWRRRAGSLPP